MYAVKCTILDRDLAERMIADLREQGDHTLADCQTHECIHYTLDRIADQFANALAELRRVEPVVDAAVVWRGTPPVNDSNSAATWVRNFTRLERAVDAMNAGVPADEDWATARELHKLRKRVAELEATVLVGDAEAERQRKIIAQSFEDWRAMRAENAQLREEQSRLLAKVGP